MPSSIKKVFKQIKISIIRIERLSIMDTFGSTTINAFVRTKWAGKEHKTKVFDRKKGKDDNCYFNETIKFGVNWPMAYDKLVI